jgi:myo-inositol 2-dehydrogenase / D-chiro-inositol 1-dehydrogenase
MKPFWAGEGKMTIRIGLIGAGVMGADHARIIATQVPGASLQYVCDADAARARAIADETGAAHVSSDPFAVIQSPDVDAVLISSPDATHAPLSLAALKVRKPALCEKPMAPTSQECLQVVEAEVSAGKRLVQLGFMRRFDPSYTEMKAVLQSGAIGAPLMLHCIHRNVSAPDWFTSSMAITNSAPHEYDIARWLLGSEFKSISAFRPAGANADKPGAPVFMVIETVDGKLVNIEVNINAAYGYDVRGELIGENGTVSLRSPVHTETNLGLAQSTSYPADWRPRFAEAYRLQNLAWIKSISTGIPTGANAWDGYMATVIGEAGVSALSSGERTEISFVPRPALYG